MKKSKIKPLQATKEDLRRAMRDALYAQRLKERGLSPFKVFIELNEIARKIRAATETPQNIHHREGRSWSKM